MTLEQLLLKDSNGNELLFNANGSLNAVVSGTVDIGTMPEIDVRALTQSDEITAFQGGTWTVQAVQSGAWSVAISSMPHLAYADDSVTAHQGGTWSVEAVQSGAWSVSVTGEVAIRALTQADEIKSYQGGAWTVTAEQGTSPWVVSGTLNVADPNSASKSSAVAMGDVAAAIPATALAARKRMQIQNVGGEPVYLGGSDVTAANGLVLAKGATESLEIGPDNILYGICASGKSSNLRVLELA